MGIEDGSHRLVGTNFVPSTARKGNEPLETWLLRLLAPRLHFRFHELSVEGHPVVLLEIERATRHPVRFHGDEFIRVGPIKKPLKEAPERERALWRVFEQTPFETLVAVQNLPADEVLRLLDYPAYFELLEQSLPPSGERIIEVLRDDALIAPCEAGGWNITNLGALLFARRLGDFGTLRRKSLRIVQYKGVGRIETVREQEIGKGYASGFEELLAIVNGILPANEVIGQALRRSVPMYPELAVRELVANALIHQDFLVTGAGPMVEVFADRLEITNPGAPLVDTRRFLDTPPRSRNDALASLMRRFRICEERGSGVDKVVFQVELFQLPAPSFETPDGFTRAVLFAPKPLGEMDRQERIRACYLHACLRHVMRQPVTNASLRERLGIDEKSAATASRLLNEAVDDGYLVVRDPKVGTRSRSYLPYWAVAATPPPPEIA